MLRLLLILIMALSGNTVWEVRTTGSDSANSGGFVTGASGTDYSQQNAAQYSAADLTVDGTTNTKVTSASHNFAAADVGNILRVTGGTGWTAGFYQIVSVASGAATLDRSPAAVSTTGGSYAVGGAFASPGQAAAAKVAGNDVFIKAGTYTLTSTSANTPGGPVNDNTGGVDTTNHSYWIGYNTTRSRWNTDASNPVISAGTQTSLTIFFVQTAYVTVQNLIVDGGSQTSVRGFSTSINDVALWQCTARNCTNNGFNFRAGQGESINLCVATGCSVQPAFVLGVGDLASALCYGCEASNNTATGFAVTGIGAIIRCLAYNNSGASSDGFGSNAGGYSAINCIARNNGRHGFALDTSARASRLFNCISTDNGGEGYSSSCALDGVLLINCAARNNTSGNYNAANLSPVNFQTLTADPFTNVAGGDFSLNTTPGGGAACRAAGFPGAFPGGTTTGYLDIGAVQHQDPPQNNQPPATPTLTVTDNGNGTGAVATISGSTAGSTNTVDVVSVAANGVLTWTNGGSRTGDGTVALSIADGHYLAITSSALNGLNSAPSQPYEFSVTGGAVGGSGSVTATGDLAIALDGVAWLIASSATFQSLVGAVDAAHALLHVPFETDDTEESGSTRPRAIVNIAPAGFEEEKVSLQNFRPRITLEVSFEAYPTGAIEAETPRETRLRDELLAFCNTLDGIIADCKANQGIGTGHITGQSQVSLSRISLVGGPGAVEEIRAEGSQGETPNYFYAAVFHFTVHG